MEQPPQTVDQFVAWVLGQDPSLREVEPRVRRQLEEDYVKELEDKITRALLDNLTEDELSLVEKLLDQGSMSELQDWMGRIPNTQIIIAEVLVRFKDEYFGD